MVARRLADESVQPASFAFNADNARWAEWKIGLYPQGRQQSAVIPLLMRAQDQDGWVSRATIEKIAEMLGMAYIRVLEVATFYTQFQLQPVGTRAHVQVCGTTPCMLRGAEGLKEVCRSKIHPQPHHLNEDGTLSWEEVECAGACVNAPMVAIFHDTYEDLTPDRLGEIIDAFHAGRGDAIKPGTQIDRLNSAPEGGRTTLLEPPSATREKFVPPAAPADAAAPAAAAKPEAPKAEPVKPSAPAAPQAPTTAAKPGDVTEESAPAVKGPAPQAKVSEAVAEAAQEKAKADEGADGTPNDAMRPNAVGAESEAPKIDGGNAPGKAKRSGAPAAANAANNDPDSGTKGDTTGTPLVDTKQLPQDEVDAVEAAVKPVRRRKPKAGAIKPTKELGGDISNDDDKSE
ncbi:MAG TPA: NADH-quinone oxidoreductase subunit NuoE [Devosia sp.]|nr:NADH-quinone oxidoreductase subunit NuoE [Devosia sp.]